MIWERLARPWQCCLEEAWMAYCSGSTPIGAVISDATGHIIARGRNRIYDAVGEGPHLHGHDLAHAEVNALVTVDYAGLDRQMCALYTTTEPCPLCFGAFYMSGLRELHYASHESWAGSVNLLGTTPYLQRKHIRLFGPDDPDLEALIVAMHIEFIYQRDGIERRRQWVQDTWLATSPHGVHLGEALVASGELRRLAAAHLSASDAINQITSYLGRCSISLGS